jgi:hypothetical protein
MNVKSAENKGKAYTHGREWGRRPGRVWGSEELASLLDLPVDNTPLSAQLQVKSER